MERYYYEREKKQFTRSSNADGQDNGHDYYGPKDVFRIYDRKHHSQEHIAKCQERHYVEMIVSALNEINNKVLKHEALDKLTEEAQRLGMGY